MIENRYVSTALAYLVIGVLLLLQFGCATSKHTDIPDDRAMPSVHQNLDNKGWWRVQFVKHWPEDTPAPFNLDVLLADLVIQPSLESNRDRIALWRFHRRANRDPAGSKFSFIFYSSIDDAKIITKDILSGDMIEELTDQKIIEHIWVDQLENVNLPDIADTSDEVWPEEIQKSWPYFIMGVSQTWLAMINELTDRYPFPQQEDSIEEMLIYYGEVSGRIDHYWSNHGGHAYIHHLSALFGYRPVGINF